MVCYDCGEPLCGSCNHCHFYRCWSYMAACVKGAACLLRVMW